MAKSNGPRNVFSKCLFRFIQTSDEKILGKIQYCFLAPHSELSRLKVMMNEPRADSHEARTSLLARVNPVCACFQSSGLVFSIATVDCRRLKRGLTGEASL